jgi:hypothetical protein
MGKVVETMVGEPLNATAERRGLLSGGKYGGRQRQWEIDTTALTVYKVHTPWTNHQIAGILLMDIKGGIPSVGRGRPHHTIGGNGMDGDLIQWTASVPMDSMVKVVIGGNAMERHPVAAGIPSVSNGSR